MKPRTMPWISRQRLARFGSVGLVATLIHSAMLVVLQARFGWSRGTANLIGFLVAFTISMIGQQRFTFRDRLQGRRLNGLGLMILLTVNAVAAFGLGSITRGALVLALPLLPAVINYGLLYLFSGRARFQT